MTFLLLYIIPALLCFIFRKDKSLWSIVAISGFVPSQSSLSGLDKVQSTLHELLLRGWVYFLPSSPLSYRYNITALSLLHWYFNWKTTFFLVSLIQTFTAMTHIVKPTSLPPYPNSKKAIPLFPKKYCFVKEMSTWMLSQMLQF